MSRPLRPALLAAAALLAFGAATAAAAPPLSAQPSALDFGLVPAQWGEQSSSVWIQSGDPDPLQLDAASVDGSAAFRVSWDGCVGQTLGSGQGCNVSVGFDPGDGAVHHGTLHVPVAGGDVLDVPLSGVGGVQQVTLAPQALAFGEVAVGETVTRSFTLTSSGNVPFQSFVAIPSGGDVGAFRVARDGCSLQPLVNGQACTVDVRFAPLAPGAAAATLLLIGGESEPAVVPLHGTGAAPPAAPPGTAATGSPIAATTVPAALAPADVIFEAAAGAPAPYAHGRIDLGRARCATGERCTVVVRSRVFALAPGAASRTASTARARMTSVHGDVVLWRLRASGRRVQLALPAGLHGRPALLVARLRTRADGAATGTRVHVVPLAPVGRR